jgi:hypothetical protein
LAGLGDAVRFAGRHIGSMFERGTERSINNLWTGLNLSSRGKKYAIRGIAGYAGYKIVQGSNEYQENLALANVDERGIMSLPSTQADGLGYQGNPGGRTDLGASGDLVFALHKLRHGG